MVQNVSLQVQFRNNLIWSNLATEITITYADGEWAVLFLVEK